MDTLLRVAIGLAITVAAVTALTGLAAIALGLLALRSPADAQAIQDADEQACALTRPDDDTAYLARVEADLTRSRAVRRLARRLETTR